MTKAQETIDRVIRGAEVPRGAPKAQLQQAQRMEAIGRLTAGVAHDFNNLLTIILGCSEMALERVPGKGPLYQDIAETISAARRAASLVAQLLTFAQDRDLPSQELNINELIAEMKGLLLRMTGKEIELITVLDPEAGCIEGHRVQIQELITNLVINARDAMRGGGTLTIRTSSASPDAASGPSTSLRAGPSTSLPSGLSLSSSLSLRAEGRVEDRADTSTSLRAGPSTSLRAGPRVLLSVSDTGPGIDEETREHMFEPFFTTKAEAGGTGLGLAIVGDIVRRCGGSVVVHSQPGQGTSFQISLPQVHKAGPATLMRQLKEV